MSAIHEDAGLATASCAAGIRLRGHCVRVEARENVGEIARRAEVGLGALTGQVLLVALASLPIEEPVRWSTLDCRTQRVLRSAPVGAVRRAGSQVVRLAVPPLTVVSITVEARAARTGLEAASTFAPFCRRSVSFPPSFVDDVVRLEAAFYGIGVQVREPSGPQVLIEPAPFVVRRWTWASWQFHEEAWGQLCGISRTPGRTAQDTGA